VVQDARPDDDARPFELTASTLATLDKLDGRFVPLRHLTSCFFERTLGPISQAEEVAHGIEEAMGVVVIVVRLGHDRADGGPGVVEMLVL
jgi:hypothetical protein